MAQTVAELQARLDKINTCIDRILDGAQEATIGSKSYREADLPFLRSWASEIEAKIDKTNRGGMVTAYGIPTN